MAHRYPARTRLISHGWPPILPALSLVSLILVVGIGSMGAAETGAFDQCVACHTDAAKLKALTPPDPPPSEAGEG